RYRAHSDWERDDLILNLVNTLRDAHRLIQDKMVWMFAQCDVDYGRRVAEGLGIPVPTSEPSGEANLADAQGGHGQPSGAAHANEAVAQAEEMGHEAKPY